MKTDDVNKRYRIFNRLFQSNRCNLIDMWPLYTDYFYDKATITGFFDVGGEIKNE